MEDRAYMITDQDTIPVTVLKKYPEYTLVMDDLGRYYKVRNEKILMNEIYSAST